ncbi:hypothetical protein B0J14DRAFT_605342 [Halenospora varia]|nr:hypothetical protein B0J14DRAFT_605342 [Halenospora varia]
MQECDNALSTLPRPGRISFLDLSREIRDIIYGFALTSPLPISAWTGEPLELCRNNLRDCHAKPPRKLKNWTTWTTAGHYHEPSRDSRRITHSLIRCNTVVSREAAFTYYGKNTFRFWGLYSWEDVSIWLQDIGSVNRGYLTNLEFMLGIPKFVEQDENGTRSRTVRMSPTSQRWRRETVRERHPLLYQAPETISRGTVEDIDHEVETVFQFLGRARNATNLIFKMILEENTIPGTHFYSDPNTPEVSWFTMDLPNLVEVFRVKHTQGLRRVDVLWTGIKLCSALKAHKDEIEKVGWEILEGLELVRDGKIKQMESGYDESISLTNFTLRQKEIVGKLVASEPASFTCD